MNLLIVIIIVLFILMIWRLLNQRYAAIKFRVRLSNLKLELASLKESSDKNAYDHLSFMISKSIVDYYFITAFWIAFHSLAKANRNSNDRYKKFVHTLNSDPKLKVIHKKFASILSLYLREQHYISYLIFIKPLVRFGFTIVSLNHRVNEYLDDLETGNNHKKNYSMAA